MQVYQQLHYLFRGISIKKNNKYNKTTVNSLHFD